MDKSPSAFVSASASNASTRSTPLPRVSGVDSHGSERTRRVTSAMPLANESDDGIVVFADS
eukprot:10274-Pelagococcus_subviridis.AAC.1